MPTATRTRTFLFFYLLSPLILPRAGGLSARDPPDQAALRARRRRAGRRVTGFVIMAQARLARRHAGRAVRSDTLLSTVKSIQRGDFPTRRAAAARAAPSIPRPMSAARVGPVVYGLLLTFRDDGYG